jgi:nucleotidyltransferase substrate binding protein (TIGR01987 family)
MTPDSKPRWQYRFDNYARAFTLLREALEAEHALSQLEKEGLIQRFEYTMELAWKTLKDYMEAQGVVLTEVMPRAIIREALAGKLIDQGQVWMDALDARNKMAHTYNFKHFEEVIEDIRRQYFGVFDALYETLLEKRVTWPDT